MIKITTLNDYSFKLEAFGEVQIKPKGYENYVSSNKLQISSKFDSDDILVPYTSFDQYTVDDVVFSNILDLQLALSAVLFNSASFSGANNETLKHFIYNPETDKLEADRAIVTTLNSLFLGEQHKMSSGAANIYFTDLTSKINWHPANAGMKDQSILANQDMSGVINAQTRVFSALGVAPLGGTPVNGTSIAYDGDNYFSFNISGVGISLVASEAVSYGERLRYSLSVDGTDVYEQFLTPLSLQPAPANGGSNWIDIDQAITWYFDHPLDIVAGSTNHASIHKIDTEGNEIGLFTVNQGNDGTGRYQTNVINRLFQDKELALKDDVASIVSGSTYKGAYNDLTSTPSLPTGSDVLGDFYRVNVTGLNYSIGDYLVYNGSTYDHIASESVTQSDLVTSSLKVHDIYVKAEYIGAVSDGSILYPYSDIITALSAANDGDSIYLDGIFNINQEIILPNTKSLYFYGSDTTTVQYSSFSDGNGSIFYFDGTDSTKELKFENIIFKNAGGYGLYTKKTKKVNIDSCTFINNGWNGTQLHTVASAAVTGLLGYDSSNTDLQAFYASSNASNGGAMRIQESTQLLIIGNTVSNNLRGIRVQDCGIGGAGVISRNQSSQNIESGIYVAAGSLGGSQNITVMMNVSAYNANNGMLVIGGLNNKFSQNEVNGNWNAGFCAWGAGNTTLRDCGLYDNNRSTYNGIGNTGDAKASIQINEAYNLLGTNISVNPAFRFIAEILDTQVHYTGLGSNTEKIGFIITSAVGDLADNDKNIIKVDDVGFIGQDYAIDFSEVNLNNLRVSLGDNSYQNIGEKAVKPSLEGKHYELPFSNHTTNINYADFSVDATGGVIVKEGVTGNRMNPYKVNDLQAVANGTKIDVILKDSDKIQFTVPVSGCSINGAFVNSVLNQALVQLNGIFTNTVGFAGGGGNPVTTFTLVANDLTIGLEDSTSFTVDVTTLGVDENNFVSSGALVGSNLVLTMDDASTVTIDAANMINGAALTAVNDSWYYSYGTYANQEVTVPYNNSTESTNNAPFYFGQVMNRGSEFRWNMRNLSNFDIGIWDGAEVGVGYGLGAIDDANWLTAFNFNGGFQDGTNTDLLATQFHGSKYVVAHDTPVVIRFGLDGHLTLVDLLPTPEVVIAKTQTALTLQSFNMQLGLWVNNEFPNGSVKDAGWEIVHDFDGSENGIYDGIKDHTVLRSDVTIVPGEKFMFDLDRFGSGERFGTLYTGAASGAGSAEEQIVNEFTYAPNEGVAPGTAWTVDTSATNYFLAGGGIPSWRAGGSQTKQGMFSLRYQLDNTIELWSETESEIIATSILAGDGLSLGFYMGADEVMTYNEIPTVTKQSITQGTQPNAQFAPTVANQTVTVIENEVLNFTIIDSDNIVNQYVEVDAPSWMTMNQVTGVLTGTAPAFAGTATDTIVVACKAGNAIGGTIDFTVTVTVASYASTNTKSLEFGNASASLQGPHANVTALQRAGNGTGAGDAWTISIWVKTENISNSQTIFYYGGDDTTNEGRIEITQFATSSVMFRYGSTVNNLSFFGVNTLPHSQWNQIVVTYDGGTTGSASGDIQDYVSRFSMYVNGSLAANNIQHNNYGWSGTIIADKFRIGRLLGSTTSQYMLGGRINQIGIWGTDEEANIATIYNGGSAQDLSLLASPPEHYYEIENSITTIDDKIGNAPLTGYGFTASDLVTDSPT